MSKVNPDFLFFFFFAVRISPRLNAIAVSNNNMLFFKKFQEKLLVLLVQKAQNFACRIVSGVKKFDHIAPVLRAMQWLPIRQQLYYRNAVMAFNCVTGCAPVSLTDQFIKRSDVSTRTTRNSQKLQIPFLKSATGQRSFYYRAVKIWNTLDPSLKLSKTLQEFKRKLKNFLLKDFIDRTT